MMHFAVDQPITRHKAWVSLNAVILLSVMAYLLGITRLILDIRFVPEVFSAMPEDQPGQTALVILLFVLIHGVWLWTLLAAARGSRRGLIALLISNLVLVFIWGSATAAIWCPTPCPVASPLTDIVTWASIIMGPLSALAVGLYLSEFKFPNGR